MSFPCAIAADTKLETPEGGLTIKSLVAKPVSVFTLEHGRARFRMARDVQLVAEQQPVVRIMLEDGAAFRVGHDQILYKKGMIQIAAVQIQPGDELVPAFHYPEGYQFQDDRVGAVVSSPAAWRVAKAEPAGEADVYKLAVHVTGCFFFTAGVLAKAWSE